MIKTLAITAIVLVAVTMGMSAVAPAMAAPTLVDICHKPNTPAEKDMSVPEQAVAGHLGHGDAEMTCTAFHFSLGSQL
jgi:hypothetical protein